MSSSDRPPRTSARVASDRTVSRGRKGPRDQDFGGGGSGGRAIPANGGGRIAIGAISAIKGAMSEACASGIAEQGATQPLCFCFFGQYGQGSLRGATRSAAISSAGGVAACTPTSGVGFAASAEERSAAPAIRSSNTMAPSKSMTGSRRTCLLRCPGWSERRSLSRCRPFTAGHLAVSASGEEPKLLPEKL